MTKVIEVIHGLSTGGAETIVKDYALGIDKTKFDINVIILNHCYDSPYEELIKENGIRIICVDDFNPFRKRNNFVCKFMYKIYQYIIFRKIIKNEQPDVIHTHLPINKYIKFSKPSLNTKIIYTMHGDPDRYKALNYGDFKAVKWLIKKYNLKIVCLHVDMEKSVQNIYNTLNTTVVNNGVDIDKIRKSYCREELRENLKIPKDAFVVGHVGRFNTVKNHKFLVEVYINILKSNNKAFLLMIGDGIEKENIIKTLNENGITDSFLILSNRSDVPELLSTMDVFVFPSTTEGLGIAVIEAQEAKLPCFISDAVPDSAIISNLVTKISLLEPSNIWSKKIINYKAPKKIQFDDSEWNLSSVIKKVEKIYMER